MGEEKGLSRVSTLKRARQLERERRRVERRGAVDVWRSSRRPALVVVATLPLAVAALMSLATLLFSQSPMLALMMAGGVYLLCLIVVVGMMGVFVATDAVFAEGRKGLARRRIVRERRELLDASEVAGGVELAREDRPGGELSPVESAGGLSPASEHPADLDV